MRSLRSWAAVLAILAATPSALAAEPSGSAPPEPSSNAVAPAQTTTPPPTAIPIADREVLQRRLAQAEAELASLRSMLGGPPSAISSTSSILNAQAPGDYGQPTPDGAASPDGAAAPDAGGADSGNSAAAPGAEETIDQQLGGDAPEPGFRMPAANKKITLKGGFGNGFEIKSEDEEYTLQIHNLTQFDGRFYGNQNQQTVKDTFVFPRQWFIFSGRLTKPLEYYVSTAEGFDTLNILDVFLNFHYDDRLQLKIGRYKTPFTYEFYNQPINGLITPERSLFFNNFGLNRDLGIMAWGMLFEKKVDYAVGIFNGRRNSFIDSNNDKDLAAYINFKPFLERKDNVFQNLNFGYSMDWGHEDLVPPVPNTFRTAVATTGNDIIGVPFMTINPGVTEMGPRQFNSLHIANYYKQLSVIGEWQFGSQSYAFNTSREFQRLIPVQSWYVQAGYFLTGETVSARGAVAPYKPFDLRKGKFGLGAWEAQARYSYLDISQSIFSSGLSNPNLYTNELYTYDVGFNWYLTQYVKFSFEYERAQFDNPTLFRTLPDGTPLRQCHSDMFLMRTQIFF